MARRIINLGSSPNAKDGDIIRDAFNKVNQNFEEIYSGEALNVSAVSQHILPATTNIYDLGSLDKQWRSLYLSNDSINFNGVPLTVTSDGTLLIDGEVAATPSGSATWSSITGKPSILTGDDVIGFTTSDTITEETPGGTLSQTTSYQNQIIVDTTDAIRIANILTQTVDDTVTVSTDAVGSTIDVDGTGIYIKRYVEPEGPNNSSYFQFKASNGGAVIEGVNEELVGNTYGRVTVTQGVVAINVAAEGLDKQWSFNSGGEFIAPDTSTIMGTNDLIVKSQINNNSSGVFLNGNPLTGTAILFAHNNSIIRADNDGTAKDWNFDKSGTITTPSLLPRLFTATVDAAHYSGEGSLTLEGDAWYFAVEFRVTSSGTVETIITNNTPWASNPGYSNNMPFAFTEADHGIPGYTFTLTLVDIQNPSQFMYTTNLAASVPPVLPATISNPEAVKLTADATSWTFSADGNLTVPGAIKQGNSKLAFNENGSTSVYLTPTTDDSTAVYINTTSVQAYGKAVVAIRGGAGLQPALDVYLESRQQLADMFNALQNEPGFPWGVTLPVGGDTSSQLNLLPPGTFPNQSAVVQKANSMDNAYAEYQDLYNNSEVSVGVGNKNWRFDSIGHLHAPNQGQVMFYDEQGAFNGAIGGDNLSHVVFAAGSTKGIKIFTDAGVKGWIFGTNGNITLPAGGDIVDSTGTSVLGGNGVTVITPDAIELPGITTLVFTGAGVTASSAGNAVTLDITGGGTTNTGNFTFTNSDITVPVNETITITAPNNTSLESKLTLSPTTQSSLLAGNTLKLGVNYGSGGEKYWTFGADGSITFPDATVQSTAYTPGADLGLLKISASTIGTKNNPDSGGWGDYSLYLDPGGESSGYIQIPSVTGQQSGGELVIANNAVNNGGIRLSVNTGNYIFADTGLEVPYNLPIRQNNSWTKVTTPLVNIGAGTVVWTSEVNYISSAKLIIQVECSEVGDASGWHSQACEAIIACRGFAGTGPTGDPQMIVYGVVHTSVNPLVTFTVQRNPTTLMVEVVGTLTAAAGGAADLRIHSVEMSTRD